MKAMLSFLLLFFFAHAVCCAQTGFTITLNIEDTLAYKAYHNEPLIFTTSLVNKTLQENKEWNGAAEEWLAQVAADFKAGKLTQEEYDQEVKLVTEGKREEKTFTVGTKKNPWFRQLQFLVTSGNGTKQPAWLIKVLGDPVTDSVARLDISGYYQVKHHLSPSHVLKLKPGIYTIKALLAGVASNEVTVKIRPQNMPSAYLHARSVQLRLGNYYLEQKNSGKALSYATAVLNKKPHDINALMLAGESYILKRNYAKALTYFESALKQFRKQFPDEREEPVYLVGTIDWLRGKLKKVE